MLDMLLSGAFDFLDYLVVPHTARRSRPSTAS